MIYMYRILYETENVTKNMKSISLSDPFITRFFCTLTSLTFLKQIVESPHWEQYSDYYLKMSEQLSDGKSTLIDQKEYEMQGTDYSRVTNMLSKDLDLIFGKVKKGLQEVFLGVDINQPQFKSTYYIYIGPNPEGGKKYRIFIFSNNANDPEFDLSIDKAVKALDKSNSTAVNMYRDSLRHNLNYNYVNVTLGAWVLLVKQNQFNPDEAMLLIVYNLNGYHLEMQQEGEEGGEEGDYYGDQGDLPIEGIEDDF